MRFPQSPPLPLPAAADSPSIFSRSPIPAPSLCSPSSPAPPNSSIHTRHHANQHHSQHSRHTHPRRIGPLFPKITRHYTASHRQLLRWFHDLGASLRGVSQGRICNWRLCARPWLLAAWSYKRVFLTAQFPLGFAAFYLKGTMFAGQFLLLLQLTFQLYPVATPHLTPHAPAILPTSSRPLRTQIPGFHPP